MAEGNISQYREVPVDGTVREVVAASPHRVALIISHPVAGNLHATPKQDATANCGLQADPNVGDIYLNVYDHGPIVKQAWYASTTVPPSTILVIETLKGDTCE